MEITNNASAKNPQLNVDSNKLKDDFLQLLMAQMKYSDPLEPPDNLSFTEQLATFAVMEQVAGINSKLDSFMKEKSGSNNLLENVNLLSSYISHNIEAKSEKINVEDGKGTGFYELKSPAKDIQVNVVSNGEILYSRDFSDQKSGYHNFNMENSGLKNGKYDFYVVALDEDGNQVKVNNTLENKVEGIDVGSGSPFLMVGGINVDPGSVTKIK